MVREGQVTRVKPDKQLQHGDILLVPRQQLQEWREDKAGEAAQPVAGARLRAPQERRSGGQHAAGAGSRAWQQPALPAAAAHAAEQVQPHDAAQLAWQAGQAGQPEQLEPGASLGVGRRRRMPVPREQRMAAAGAAGAGSSAASPSGPPPKSSQHPDTSAAEPLLPPAQRRRLFEHEAEGGVGASGFAQPVEQLERAPSTRGEQLTHQQDGMGEQRSSSGARASVPARDQVSGGTAGSEQGAPSSRAVSSTAASSRPAGGLGALPDVTPRMVRSWLLTSHRCGALQGSRVWVSRSASKAAALGGLADWGMRMPVFSCTCIPALGLHCASPACTGCRSLLLPVVGISPLFGRTELCNLSAPRLAQCQW